MEQNNIFLSISRIMEKLEKFDPYTIQDIEFYIQKKSKYTTLKSILISLLIIALTIIISFDSLKQIWAKRTQLDIYSNNRKIPDQPLTSNSICVVSKTLGQNAPVSTLKNINSLTNTVLKVFDKTDNFNAIPQILNIVGLKNFYCYDLEGMILDNQKAMDLILQSPGNVLLKTTSINQILGIQQPNYHYFDKTALINGITYFVYLKKITYIAYDSLLVDYTPQESHLIERVVFDYSLGTSNNYMQLYFSSGNRNDNQLTSQIIIKRQNIGSILGKFFSWFTILIIIFTFIIAPIVQYNFKVTLTKRIYDHKTLNNIQVSLLAICRYILSFFKNDMFDQSILQIAFKKLQKDTDILILIKRQQIMNKIITQNQNIQNKKQQIVELTNEYQQGKQFQEITFNLIMPQQINDISQKKNQTFFQKQQTSFEAQLDQQFICKNLIYDTIKSLDIGQTTISLISNKGDGYGTKWNSILFGIFFFLVLFFLIFAGFFTISDDIEVATVLQGTEKISEVTIDAKDIIFRAIKTSMWDDYTFKVYLVDQNYQIIQDLVLLSNQDCDLHVKNLNQTIGSGWQCLNRSSIGLKNDGANQKQSLLLQLNFPAFSFAFTMSKFQIVYKSTNFINDQFSDQIKKVSSLYTSNSLKVYEVQTLQNQLQNIQQLQWTTYQYLQYANKPKSGISFQLLPQVQSIRMDSNTIWDVIDNSWGIFILSFTIILAKISRVNNIRKREQITSTEDNQNRNDIISIVTTQYKIGLNMFKKELQSIRYYYKVDLKKENDQVK